MRYLVFILLLCSCSEAKMLVVTVCDDVKMEFHFRNFIADHDDKNHSERIYYRELCAKEERTLYCHEDSVVNYKDRQYPYKETPRRIKNKIINISR